MDNSPDLPSLFQYDRSNTSTIRSPTVMLATNDENLIHKSRRKRTTPERNTRKRVNCIQRLILGLPIFHPFGIFKRFWDFIITLMLIFAAIEIPITFVAALDVWTYVNVWSVSALVIDGFLFIDILMSFRTARFFKYDHLKLEVNAFKIAKRYIVGTFFIDIATAFPYQLIMNYNQYHIAFTFLRSLKLIRLYNMMRQSTSNRSITSSHKRFRSFMKIFKLGCAVLLIIHYTACIWWFEGETVLPSWMDTEGARDLDTFDKYSYSLYFVVTIKFVKATNVIEQWITIIHTLVGTATLSYFIGTLSSMISKGDKMAAIKQTRIDEAQAFCDQYHVPTKMKRAILAHLKYHYANNYTFDNRKIFDNIPNYLSKLVSKHLAQRVVEKITFFRPLRSDVRGLIALKTKSISCNAGHKLFKKGDKYNKIYIQRTGRALLTFHDGSGQRMIKRRGDVFGEDAMCAYLSGEFNGQSARSISTLQCKTWSEFYVINVQDVIDILKSEFSIKWRDKLKEITKIVVVKDNIYNNRYTPRYKVTGIDLATSVKTKTQKSLQKLFQFNEFESIIHPQLDEMNASTSDMNNVSPLESDDKMKHIHTIAIETQNSSIQLADLKRKSTYLSISMQDLDDIDDKSNKSESTEEQDYIDIDDDIDIIIEETKETNVINSVNSGNSVFITVNNVDAEDDKNDDNDMDNDDNNSVFDDDSDENDDFGQANNLYAISKQFSRQRNGKKHFVEKQQQARKYVSDNQLKNGAKSERLKNPQECVDQNEAIDRATTLSVLDTKPINMKKSNSNWKPRSNSFSISDDFMETRRNRQNRNRTSSFNLRRSYFKKTKSELRDRHLSIEYDGRSVAKLTIPNIPENNTIYKLDEDMD